MTDNHRHRSLATILIALSTIVVADQLRFVFTYPVIDTGMWFGDETWTMLTVRELARSGIARIPEALGSSLSHSNGLVNGCIWVSGAIYGFPAIIFSSLATPVAIGRIVTLIFSLAIVYVVFHLSRSLTRSSLVASLAVLVLVLSRAFYFSSHSARLDAITGLAIILFLSLLLKAYDSGANNRVVFLISLLAPLTLTIYVHVPTIIALPFLYSLWQLKVLSNGRRIAVGLSGFACGVAIIALTYYISTGSLDLLGSGYNQYYNVANSLPVLHLRSWRVQKINTIDRAIQVCQVAWPIVIAIVLGIVFRFWNKNRFTVRERFFLWNSILAIIGWGLFEGPAVFYNIHILPVAAVIVAILWRPLEEIRSKSLRWIAPVMIVATIFVIVEQERVGAIGTRLSSDNSVAIHSLVDTLASANASLILTDQPAINEIAGVHGVRLMTNHLLLFGGENKPLPEILREKHVNYLLLYSTDRWQSPFRSIADSLCILQGTRIGTLTDQARSYDDPRWGEQDTLRLYKTRW